MLGVKDKDVTKALVSGCRKRLISGMPLRFSAEDWIQRLRLEPHPEGGHFREVYRSREMIPQSALPERYGGDRPYGTSIYFMVKKGERSAWHRLKSDEIWHFYAGVPANVYMIDPEGSLRRELLGIDESGEGVFQVLVPAGVWMSTVLSDPEGYALMGCTVMPGFDFKDFELAKPGELEASYPEHSWLFAKLP